MDYRNGIILVLCILVFAAEYDRLQSYPASIKNYYGDVSARPILGFYNGLIRLHSLTHPSIMYDVGNWFPRHTILRNNWKLIANEIVNIRKEYELPKMHDLVKTFDRISDDKWSVFVVKWYDKPSESNCKLAPYTCSLLDQLPEIRACMFSILEPGKFIPPHKGPYKGSLRYHLGLQIPKSGDCYIQVEDIKYYWKEGEDIIFDDTYKHCVYNNSNETRIVLFCDVDRPMVGPMNVLNKALNNNAPLNSWVKAINQNGEKVSKIDSVNH